MRPAASTRLVIVVAVAVTGSAAGQPAATSSSPPEPVDASILYVSLDDPFQRYVRQRLEGFRDGLAAAGRPVNLYLEFFDQARFGDRPTYAAEFRAWLHQKCLGAAAPATQVWARRCP